MATSAVPRGYTLTDSLREDEIANRCTAPERRRCSKHPRRWEIWCWIWKGAADDEDCSVPKILRSCQSCVDEDEAAELGCLG